MKLLSRSIGTAALLICWACMLPYGLAFVLVRSVADTGAQIYRLWYE